MKHRFVYAAFMFLLILSLCGCTDAENKITEELPEAVIPAAAEDATAAEAPKESETVSSEESRQSEEVLNENTIAGVSIDFEYMRMSGKASNQLAVWVEDENGELVKTLLVTDFTAGRRGYENREDALNHWVTAAEPGERSDEEIDAVSSATPQAGTQHFSWDLTDENGQRVPDDRYYIRLEGTLYWSSNVLYTGMIDLKEAVPGELEITIERSEPDNTVNEAMIQNVRMSAMAENKNTVDNTANWLGGLEPEKALEYMKEHYGEGLVIVEVNTDYWKLETGFTGAMHIPHDQMAERYDEIPSGVPVILHCGGGIVSVPAYETLMEKRPDIPQLSYIAGHPLVEEFNEWLEKRNR